MRDQQTYQRIMRLRAVRTYIDEPISEEDLDAILEAARWTGSSKNNQNWKFVVIRDPDQKERLAAAGDFTDPVKRAPCVIALVDLSHGYEFDVGRAAQNIMLAADAIGVASCPITLHRGDVAAAVLELPEGATVRYAVALGYGAPGPTARQRYGIGGRKERAEVVSFEKY